MQGGGALLGRSNINKQKSIDKQCALLYSQTRSFASVCHKIVPLCIPACERKGAYSNSLSV
jgi:hypothetical protein